MTPTVVEHFDTCLGCMACETACPSGVRYAPLIEQTRAAIEHHHTSDRSATAGSGALLFSAAAVPGAPARCSRCRWRSSDVLQRSPAPARAAAATSRATSSTLAPDRGRGTDARSARAHAGRRANGGCASASSPAACSGCSSATSTRPPRACWPPRAATSSRRAAQGCCGALALHAGRDDDARRLRAAADRRRSKRAASTSIVVNAAGCGSTMKDYGELLQRRPGVGRAGAGVRAPRCAMSPKSLGGLGPPRAPRHPLPLRVAYHDACHLAHAQGVRQRAARAPGRHSRRHARPDRRERHLLRQRRHLQPRAARDGRRARPPQGAHIADGDARHRRHLQPGLHPADSHGRCGARASTRRASFTSSSSSTLDLGPHDRRRVPASRLRPVRPLLTYSPARLWPVQLTAAGSWPVDRDLRHDPARRHAGRRRHLLRRRQAARSPSGSTRSACTTSKAAGRARNPRDIEFFEQAKHRTFQQRAAGRLRLDAPQGHAPSSRTNRCGCSSTPTRRSSPSSARRGCCTCSRCCRPRPKRTWR